MTTVAKVRVRVEDKLLLIPLTSPQLTIKQLAVDVANRFSRQNEGGPHPILSLATSDLALLDPGDLVTTVVDAADPLLVATVTR